MEKRKQLVFYSRRVARLCPPDRAPWPWTGRLPAPDGRHRASDLALWPATGTDCKAAFAAQRSRPARQRQRAQRLRPPGPRGWQPPLVEFVSAGAIRERSLQIFDRSFAVTYWLQAVAIGIGLFGVAASFSAQVLARRKEFGLLAHLGLTRRQILAVVAGEGAAWTGMGHRRRAAGPGRVRGAGACGQPAELSLDHGDEHAAGACGRCVRRGGVRAR
jgi:hypothetical protein